MCAHYRMKPIACEKRDPESKGGVENGVRYVKHNALAGREFTCFEDYQRLAVYWRDEVANVRIHGTTREQPIRRFEEERQLLRALPEIPFDTDEVVSTAVTPHARVKFDTNRYSVPPEFNRKEVILRADAKFVRVLHLGKEIACPRRCWEKHKLLVDPTHLKAALARRKRSQARQIEINFDALGPEAKAYREGLLGVPVRPIVHLRQILKLVVLYGRAEVLAALARAVEYQTFDSAYIVNLIDQERRKRQLPSLIPLAPKRQELLEDIHLEEPDPGDYDQFLI